MRKVFVRSEQKFWILRRENPWSIFDFKTNKKVGIIKPEDANAIEGDFLLCDSLEEIEELVAKSKNNP